MISKFDEKKSVAQVVEDVKLKTAEAGLVIDNDKLAEIEDLAAQRIHDAVDDLKLKAIESLERVVGPGRISPETAGLFLKTSYRSLYRWLSGSLYRPSLEQCQLIVDFVLRVGAIREACVELLALKFPENPDLRTALLNPRILRVLERKIPYEDKLSLLVKQIVREIAPKEKDSHADPEG